MPARCRESRRLVPLLALLSATGRPVHVLRVLPASWPRVRLALDLAGRDWIACRVQGAKFIGVVASGPPPREALPLLDSSEQNDPEAAARFVLLCVAMKAAPPELSEGWSAVVAEGEGRPA